MVGPGRQTVRPVRGARTAPLLATLLLIAPAAWCPAAWCDRASAGGQPWTGSLDFPDDPVIHGEGDLGPGWVKFLIFTDATATVYFQDSGLYPFHYDFATAELAPFAGMTPAEFDAVTLYATGQQAILGAVLVPPTANGQHVVAEYGIQLVRADPYDPFVARDALAAVRDSIVAPGAQPFYMPTFEQHGLAEANAAFYESEGFPLASPARWQDGNSCYAHGWALGTLKMVPASQIDSAFVAGQLTPEDVLLTDAVPAEIPPVAGVLTLSPATPNSHVALLAQTFGVPFAFLSVQRDADAAEALVGRRVFVRVRDRFGRCQVRVVDTEGQLDAGQVDELLAFKAPPPLDLDPVEPLGAYSASTDGLTLADVRYFGGKAANTGLLRQAIASNSPVSTAFSFDLWTAFGDQPVPGGQTLRQWIEAQLAPFAWPPDVGALDAALDGVRDRIEDETTFSPALESAVLATLQDTRYGFDPGAALRFRSSTNVEDTEQFTGAGLYESHSGCLADDLDGDASGPSHCDPGEPSERGVFRAIRKVFASFYGLNPYLERLRHGVDEDVVGMALLVHHAFPDATELANGVATYTRGPGATQHAARLVLQPGANSVTNPLPGQVPEEVGVFITGGGGTIYPTVEQGSNLVLLGETVLDHPAEYVALVELLRDVAQRYETVTGLGHFVLDYEFKKTAPGDHLVVTQVRRVPLADTTTQIAPFLLDEPITYCTFQGEGAGDVLGRHRLKSRWTVSTDSRWLTADALEEGFLDHASIEFVEGCGVWEESGPFETFAGFAHGWSAGTATASWTIPDLQNPRSLELEISGIPELVAPAESPVVLLTDFGVSLDYGDRGCLWLTSGYASPVPEIDLEGQPVSTSTDYAALCPCPPEGPHDLLITQSFSDAGMSVDTRFYWPKPPSVAAGYTAPLLRFVDTTISGATAEPIVLTAPWAQTHKPGHHNFTSEFVFEPALDPSVPQPVVDELTAAGIRTLYVANGFSGETILPFDDGAWGFHCLDCRGPDADGDQRCLHEPSFDCDDSDPGAWSVPGEVGGLVFPAKTALSWDAPADPGGTVIVYDTLRSAAAGDFAGGECLETAGADLVSLAGSRPGPGEVAFFLVRADNACQAGPGGLGAGSDGTQRIGPDCP